MFFSRRDTPDVQQHMVPSPDVIRRHVQVQEHIIWCVLVSRRDYKVYDIVLALAQLETDGHADQKPHPKDQDSKDHTKFSVHFKNKKPDFFELSILICGIL